MAPPILRFIVCGSAGAGKTTLVDGLRNQAQGLWNPRPAELENDWWPMRYNPDAECESSLAPNVAVHGFTTAQRAYVVADLPDGAWCTRKLIHAAATADLALIVVDARTGVCTQARRQSVLLHLWGVRHVVLVVNKLDAVAHSQEMFEQVAASYLAFAAQLGINQAQALPLAALHGDNMAGLCERMPWYAGPSLMAALEACEVDDKELQARPLRLQVAVAKTRPKQTLGGPDLAGRRCAGRIATGRVRVGERVRMQPCGRESSVVRINGLGGELQQAIAGQSVILELADDIEVSPGDVVSLAADPAEVADQFECTLLWGSDAPLLPGRPYVLQIGARRVNATVTELKYRLNVNTLEHVAARTLAFDDIAVCNVSLDGLVPFDAYRSNPYTGSFVLIDRVSQQTLGAGLLHFALRRAHNIQPQALSIDKAARGRLLGQQPVVLWFTGLSGAGKSTIANLVEQKLHALGRHCALLDGDNVRHGLNRDLGFTDADRVENIRRVAEVARLMVEAGLIVITAFISPFRAERRLARERLAAEEFIEIHVDVPLALAETRDPKGLYAKARRGALTHFTGIDSPYETPQAPELHIDAATLTAEQASECVIEFLRSKKLLGI